MSKRTFLRWSIPLGLAAAVGCALLMFLGGGHLHGRGTSPAAGRRQAVDDQRPAVAVTVGEVTQRAVERRVRIVGTFHGHDEADVAAKVEGRVVRIRHDVGDVVRPGDVLLEIDDTEYRLAVDEAQCSLDLELAKLGLHEIPGDDFDVHGLPTVVKARREATNAKSKFERRRGVKQFNTAEELDQLEAEFEIAQANHDQMLLEADSTLATVRHRQAVLATAGRKLAETMIRVPLPSAERLDVVRDWLPTPRRSAGEAPKVEYVVSSRQVSEGELVRTSAGTLFHLVMDQPLKLLAAVPERHVGELAIGQTVEIAVEAYPSESFQGQLSRLNPTVDSASRTFEIEVLVANKERRLRSGSFAKGEVITRHDAEALTVPEESLVSFAGVTKVFVVEDDQAIAVPVEVGEGIEVPGDDRVEHWVEVVAELEPRSLVVTSGQTQLTDGAAVRVRE